MNEQVNGEMNDDSRDPSKIAAYIMHTDKLLTSNASYFPIPCLLCVHLKCIPSSTCIPARLGAPFGGGCPMSEAGAVASVAWLTKSRFEGLQPSPTPA